MHFSGKFLGQHLYFLRVFLMVMEDDTEALYMILNFLERVNKN